jgi:signal transduction histidine kinase
MLRRFAPHPVPWPVLVALCVSTAIVLGSAYVSRRNIEKVAGITEKIINTGDLLDAAMRMRSVLHAAETGQRGYLLTADKEYLAPYLRGTAVIGDVLAELRRLSAGRVEQQRRVAALEKLVAEKLAELRSTIDAMDRGDRAEALRIVNRGGGRESMESMVAILSDIRAEAVEQRALYKSLAQEQRAISEASELATAAAVLLQIALCYFLLLRYLRQRREAEAKLAALNERLEADVEGRTVELRGLSRHLMSVREDEKARIARELHDEMGSSLTAVNMDIASVQQRLGTESTLASRLARAAATLRSTVEGMRRIIEDLRPTMLEGLGLREAVRSLAADFSARMGIPITIDMPDELPPLKEGVPIALFRIVQEALTNVSRHARPASVKISLRAPNGGIVLVIEDDGVGIPRPAHDMKRSSHGLLGIRERATAMGGTSSVGPGPDGRGTAVRVVLPSPGASAVARSAAG